MTKYSESELAERIAAGDCHAESELFQRFEKKISVMVYLRLRTYIPREDQEDIIAEIKQAVLTSLRKNAFDHQKGKTIGAYIAGIAHNMVGQYFRKLEKEKVIHPNLPNDIIENTPDMLDTLITIERSRKLKELLGRLHPKYEKILVLRYYEYLGITEIARQLNLEPRRVSERLNYAVKKLAALIAKKDDV